MNNNLKKTGGSTISHNTDKLTFYSYTIKLNNEIIILFITTIFIVISFNAYM